MTGPAFAEYPKTVVLTDGAHLTLRPLTAADRGAAAALGAPLSASAGALGVVAVDGERVVALLTLDGRGPEAAVGIVLDPAYRARRLGTWLLLDGVHLAGALGMERLIATVPAHDHDQLAALRRLDFAAEAARGQADGAVVMTKTLHRGWPEF